MTDNHNTTKKTSFLARRCNTIVATLIVFAVLIGGYFIVENALVEEAVPSDTEEPAISLLPGEVSSGTATLVYPSIDRKQLKEVRIHNPSNEQKRGSEYVDWGISFLYDAKDDQSIGYMLGYEEEVFLDETKLSSLAAAVGNVVFSRRPVDECEDFSIYGLSEETATRVEVELVDGTVYTIYVGNKNPAGTGYYIRSADTVTDADGKPYERKSVYLASQVTTTYFDMTLMELPTAMVTTMMAYPVNPETGFTKFELISSDNSIAISLRPFNPAIQSADMLFGGSCNYYSVLPAGYFSSPAFDMRKDVFEMFQGAEVMEYSTKPVTSVDEDGKEYTYFDIENETLAEYGLENGRVKYILRFSSKEPTTGEILESEIWFSSLRSDGYYYARSLNFGTIVKVGPETVDFLGWKTLDFLDAYALRMSIGHCEKLTVKGTIDGKEYTETFTVEMDKEYKALSAYAENLGKNVSMDQYRILFRELLTTTLRDSVSEALTQEEKEAVMAGKPYFELQIQTPNFGKSERFPNGLKSVTRILRFYQYTNGRALLTVEMIDSEGKSSGESGEFYVRVSRLDKLISDTKKLCDGIPFDFYDKE